jgi:hypothetical protein
MNDPTAVANRAGTLLPPMAARSRGAIEPAWKPSSKRLSKKDTLTAGAFMIFYVAAYLAAGYAGVTMIEWVWMRVFG